MRRFWLLLFVLSVIAVSSCTVPVAEDVQEELLEEHVTGFTGNAKIYAR